MSCYMVENETINRIVSGLEYAKNHGTRINYVSLRDNALSRMIGDRKQNEEMVKALAHMNARAVYDRYPHHGGYPAAEVSSYAYKSTMPPGLTQFLKSLRCYLYQCSEGNVPKESLFMLLEELSYDIALHIAENTPEYERAQWA